MNPTRFCAGLLLPLLIWSCASKESKPAQAAERNWEGEVRIQHGDTAFVPCGSTMNYRLTGPGTDSIAHKYAFLLTQPGQWIKTWCTGHATAATSGPYDSLLVCAAYMHMDATVHCPPTPVDSLSGTYTAKAAIAGGQHSETLIFLPDGGATIISTAPGLYAEVDGSWGLNANGTPIFQEARNRYTFEYRADHGRLERAMPGRNDQVVYVRTGAADRLTGAFGRTAQWLAAEATAAGYPVQADRLRPTTSLDSIFPDATARNALRASAKDSLGLDEKQLVNVWDAASTVQDVTLLMRSRIQAAH